MLYTNYIQSFLVANSWLFTYSVAGWLVVVNLVVLYVVEFRAEIQGALHASFLNDDRNRETFLNLFNATHRDIKPMSLGRSWLKLHGSGID